MATSRPAHSSLSTPGRGGDLFCIDPRVTEWGVLARAVPSSSGVVVLDPVRDGLEQVAEALATREGVANLHLIAHGEPGTLHLGNGPLDAETVTARWDLLARLGTALGQGGEILLYGCRVAAREAGADLVNRLAAATGVAVAASDRVVGAAGAGGSWWLNHGGIDLRDYFRPGALENYQGSFEGEPTVVSLTADPTEGTYGLGDTLSIDVLFSAAVVVTGTPRLLLNLGGDTPRYASYLTGSNTNTLTFTYTVQEGDGSSDLGYANINALSPNGGSIQLINTSTSAILTLPAPGADGSLSGSSAVVVNTSLPVLTGLDGETPVAVTGELVYLDNDEPYFAIEESTRPATFDGWFLQVTRTAGTLAGNMTFDPEDLIFAGEDGVIAGGGIDLHL